MKKLALGALFAGLLAACGGGGNNTKIKVVDSSTDTGISTCSPLTQVGCQASEKCTWIIDQTTPTYVGHIGCVANGTAAIGGDCMFGAPGATGYDNCSKGGVCSAFGTTGAAGKCKQICDNNGGDPMCDSTHVCVTYSKLFSTGSTSPAAAGVCDLACDPLADNDFDGSGSNSHKTKNTCPNTANAVLGCYGAPSRGTPPVTGWSCTGDINANVDGTDKNLRHRVECTSANGCADTDGTIYLNSCNQGYEPLFRESTAVSTAVCIAFCKPLNCYSGNCGVGNANRLGQGPVNGSAGNRCQVPDRAGTFNTQPAHEECEYLWSEELDGSGNFLPSPTSDTMGFCFDHFQYMYDPTGGNNPTIHYPGCEQLELVGSGSDPSQPLSYWGAVNFGCVDTTLAFGSGSAAGKRLPMKTGITMDRPRFLYHRVMGGQAPTL
ncbi:MAG: hypothetical protein JO257_30170 [Deltaproteobacteria bacterium]|nr:hypothetical protein [Deltaproteobacteria bacterium]